MTIAVISSLSGQINLGEKLKNNAPTSVEKLSVSVEDHLGNRAEMPIGIVKGKEKGQVFTIVAGVHGYEYPPIMAVLEVLQEINPQNLKGDLLFLPIANTPSFYGRSPFVNPQDKINLNRTFPGKKDGTITERMAHFITNEVIPVSDVFLDIHGGDANGDLVPFVCYYDNPKKPQQTEMARQLSEVSDFDIVVSYPYNLSDTEPTLYAFKQAVQNGKIAFSFEAGKLGGVQRDAVDLIKKGIYNILSELGMYADNQANKIRENKIRLNNQAYVKAEHQGILYSDLKAGDEVKKGQKVAEIRTIFGEILTELKAPESGIILYKIGTPPVNIGETIMCISYKEN
ncbi:MAG: succinylglutamate desuccinylase/aspartoacylase family protein [Bergeyella zoohelcum]|nr:succinylglutamate desuccinylase/aspartoacylase family protein [Bergeyella zoohelcum]